MNEVEEKKEFEDVDSEVVLSEEEKSNEEDEKEVLNIETLYIKVEIKKKKIEQERYTNCIGNRLPLRQRT